MAPLPSKPSELKRVVSKGVNQKVRSLSNRQRSRLSEEDEDNGREAFLGSTFAHGQEPPAGFTQDASRTSSMGVHRNGSQMPQGYGYGAPPPPPPPGAHGGGRSAEEQEEIDLALAMAASMATHEQESRAPPRVSADSAAEADEEEQLRRALELSKLEDTTRRLADEPNLIAEEPEPQLGEPAPKPGGLDLDSLFNSGPPAAPAPPRTGQLPGAVLPNPYAGGMPPQMPPQMQHPFPHQGAMGGGMQGMGMGMQGVGMKGGMPMGGMPLGQQMGGMRPMGGMGGGMPQQMPPQQMMPQQMMPQQMPPHQMPPQMGAMPQQGMGMPPMASPAQDPFGPVSAPAANPFF
ncbi:hypothetical protein EMIHUDRAFT_446832 [Emiliania huxleyi CCMP1516]|uniref:Uncharacterized protein n=2 Tax=Emiliania huxleyi TaxID=2903 RepID=A0A0D3KTS0_EMIH1|nr:hypothetical protein EMIHUDRAFT_446832 [Emiliania huxleyi CCMP1516]EOD39155.1 hypothetical protein EMIHUDRAFT_446832 [Emiliania huxleyi CCMP1516]|eukprot:XP_005791584.1 hypothetical protein EMIHUDRAFT_446832 [Emiliania huxleyi CCMP1516]